MIASPSVVTELGVDLMEVAGVDGAQAVVFDMDLALRVSALWR